jgi:hypothetical protein
MRLEAGSKASVEAIERRGSRSRLRHRMGWRGVVPWSGGFLPESGGSPLWRCGERDEERGGGLRGLQEREVPLLGV